MVICSSRAIDNILSTMMNKVPIIAPYIYDARYHVHPYILSTTVLTDTAAMLNRVSVRSRTIGPSAVTPAKVPPEISPWGPPGPITSSHHRREIGGRPPV